MASNNNRLKTLLGPLRNALAGELDHFAGNRADDPKFMRDRDVQLEFGTIAKPIMSAWVTSNMECIRGELGHSIILPEGLDEYQRNAVFTPCESRVGLFAHVWRPGGKTPIHQHEGLLALACAVDRGAHETKFRRMEQLEHSLWQLEISADEDLVPSDVSVITRDEGSIHVVRNDAHEPCLILEAYVYPRSPEYYALLPADKRPLAQINAYVPIHEWHGAYLVERRSTSDLPRPIISDPPNTHPTLSVDEMLAEIGHDQRIAGSVITRFGETFATREGVKLFAATRRSRFVRVPTTNGRARCTYVAA